MNKEEAMKILKDFHDKSALFSVRTALETLHPELKESKDEKIRKELVDFIYNKIDTYELREKSNSWLAWLEKQGNANKEYWRGYREGKKEILDKYSEHASFLSKIQVGDKVTRNEAGVLVNISQLNRVAKSAKRQGEQKHADKVEPKFHEGDWIVHHGTENIYQVVAVIDNQYQLKYGDTYTVQKCTDVDRCARLWDIEKDAKDGDVLCTYECDEPKIVFILKGTLKKHYALSYHCYYNIMYLHFGSDSEKGCLAPNDEDVKPATKEQRDTLFAKMKESGYEWDAEKKELKKIEQKPAWKPTGEQMKFLWKYAEQNNYDGRILTSLYNNLKKLKG